MKYFLIPLAILTMMGVGCVPDGTIVEEAPKIVIPSHGEKDSSGSYLPRQVSLQDYIKAQIPEEKKIVVERAKLFVMKSCYLSEQNCTTSTSTSVSLSVSDYLQLLQDTLKLKYVESETTTTPAKLIK